MLHILPESYSLEQIIYHSPFKLSNTLIFWYHGTCEDWERLFWQHSRTHILQLTGLLSQSWQLRRYAVAWSILLLAIPILLSSYFAVARCLKMLKLSSSCSPLSSTLIFTQFISFGWKTHFCVRPSLDAWNFPSSTYLEAQMQNVPSAQI